MPTVNLDSLLKDLNIKPKAGEVPVILVDLEEKFMHAVEEVSAHSRVGFDAEGVNLSRTGELTIATFQGFDGVAAETPIYVVDIEVLGGDIVFSKMLPSFRSLLEDSAVNKVTFDCRGDSDALFRQFGIYLAGVLGLYVFVKQFEFTKVKCLPKGIYILRKRGSPFFQAWKKCCRTTLQKLPLESRVLRIEEIQMFGRRDHSRWPLSTMLVTM